MPANAREFVREGANVLIFSDAASACRHAADRVAEVIRSASADRGQAVLGLATGGTPVRVYERLVALQRAGELSFRDVATYNLDEYYPVHPLDPNSYRYYMHRHLFDHVDIAANRAHVLDGTVPEHAAAAHAAEFDRWVAADGGLDLQLLGIGRNGHIGFNEPSDLSVEHFRALPTRLVDLHPVTVADAARDFGDDSLVIRRALTVGTATILAARSVLMLALGPAKAEPVARALTGPVTAALPASLLRTAPGRVTWVLDEPAAAGLR
jgi:glucosamine-6-phosphate deaminase